MSKTQFSPGDVPSKPGVYVFRDSFGAVIYVGKAANLRKRVSQYFQPSRETRADPKLRSLINSIASWECVAVRTENESLILESRLIKDYAPRYNVLLRDDKRYLLVKIDLNEKFPRLRLARLRKDDGCRYFGPFPKGSALRETAEFLVRWFGLRSCKTAVPTEEDMRHCLARVIRDCSCPCNGKVSEAQYMARVESLMKVLEGNVREIVEELKSRMSGFAAERRFERAALYRDIIQNIESLYGAKNRSFANASLPSESGAKSVDDLKAALKLSSPPGVIEAFDISNIGGTLAVASLVRFEDGRPDRKGYRRFRIKTVEGSDDFAMMAEAVTRHFSRRLEEGTPLPDLVLVDGGKGQLNAAIDALVRIKCPPLPVLGLAKKNEEVFVPGRQEPLVLDRTRPALKLLQAIRDEAHRFAVSYHRELRMKRIQDSLLDEIEGIGPARKRALLTEFGSVRRLREASPEEIVSRVPGIGPEFARTVYEFLSKHRPSSSE